MNAFEKAYQQALYRIEQMPSKVEGLSLHGHRHAMGRRLEKANVEPHIIKKVLHHKSLESQLPYTTPGVDRVNKVLAQSYATLEHLKESDNNIFDWNEITKYGFEDIDPEGLLTGPFPKLKGKE